MRWATYADINNISKLVEMYYDGELNKESIGFAISRNNNCFLAKLLSKKLSVGNHRGNHRNQIINLFWTILFYIIYNGWASGKKLATIFPLYGLLAVAAATCKAPSAVSKTAEKPRIRKTDGIP